MTGRLIRFKDLQRMGIVNNRPSLKRLQENYGFTPGFMLGDNTRVFDEDIVKDWVEKRAATATAPKPNGDTSKPKTCADQVKAQEHAPKSTKDRKAESQSPPKCDRRRTAAAVAP